MPLLSKLVRNYCITHASSVPSDSAFSMANYIQRKQRSSLSSKQLRYQMLLKDKLVVESSHFPDLK